MRAVMERTRGMGPAQTYPPTAPFGQPHVLSGTQGHISCALVQLTCAGKQRGGVGGSEIHS